MAREDEDVVADQEERMINEEYKIWKKNTPFLYGAFPRPGFLKTFSDSAGETPNVLQIWLLRTPLNGQALRCNGWTCVLPTHGPRGDKITLHPNVNVTV